MDRPRDSQRQKVYDAESVITGKIFSWQETQEYVSRVTHSKFWLSLGGRPGVTCKDGRGRSHAAGSNFQGYVTMPRYSRFESALLHELAHVLTDYWLPGHGATFASNYLKLVRHFMGVEYWKKLKASFKLHKVKMTLQKG